MLHFMKGKIFYVLLLFFVEISHREISKMYVYSLQLPIVEFNKSCYQTLPKVLFLKIMSMIIKCTPWPSI